MSVKNAEFYADFKAVAKTLMQKILSAKKRRNMKFFTLMSSLYAKVFGL
jgi:hypothetical protein